MPHYGDYDCNKLEAEKIMKLVFRPVTGSLSSNSGKHFYKKRKLNSVLDFKHSSAPH